MQYLLRLTDASANKMLVASLPETVASNSAVDIIFDVIGCENPDELVRAEIVSEGQLEDLRALQHIIFDRDGQGFFIRDDISFKTNGRDLNPDAPLIDSFLPADKEGIKYMRCDLVVEGGAQPAGSSSAAQSGPGAAASLDAQIKELANMLFLHEIAIGFQIDVTKDYPELADAITFAERKGLIEVDVQKVSYKLTEEGRRVHDSYMAEAQDLVRRFDIYCDVDVDSSGTARFDTGLGRDLRVPAFEMEGVDPFRARFLLGLNDGEWDQLSNWFEVFEDPEWYGEIFEVVERAPSVESIGRQRMQTIMEQAKSRLRQEWQSQH
jgi:hypothetical protein